MYSFYSPNVCGKNIQKTPEHAYSRSSLYFQNSSGARGTYGVYQIDKQCKQPNLCTQLYM